MDQEKIGNLIKKIRNEHNLTQKELADQLGVTFQAVSKWERGLNIPDIQQLKAICDLYNLDIKDFVDGEKKEKIKDTKIVKAIIMVGILTILLVISLVVYIKHNSSFKVLTISGEACDLTVNGNAAYDNDHTSIFITSVKYCGKDKDIIYKQIDCMIYQIDGNTETKLSELSKNNTTIDAFLEDVTFNIDSHKTTCSKITKTDLMLTLNVTDNDDKVTTYKVPLNLKDTCN